MFTPCKQWKQILNTCQMGFPNRLLKITIHCKFDTSISLCLNNTPQQYTWKLHPFVWNFYEQQRRIVARMNDTHKSTTPQEVLKYAFIHCMSMWGEDNNNLVTSTDADTYMSTKQCFITSVWTYKHMYECNSWLVQHWKTLSTFTLFTIGKVYKGTNFIYIMQNPSLDWPLP